MERESSSGRAVRGRRRSIPIPSRPTPKRERPKVEQPPPATEEQEKEDEEEQKKAAKRRKKDEGQEEQKQQRQLRPRPPVGPRSSFLFFVAAKSDDVAAENPYASKIEQLRIVGQMWRSMHMDEREVCVSHSRAFVCFHSSIVFFSFSNSRTLRDKSKIVCAITVK